MYESGENYLETILMLSNENGTVRSVDVARRLDVSKPSVSRAVGLLKQGEYITVDQKGYLHLTAMGDRKRAAKGGTDIYPPSGTDCVSGENYRGSPGTGGIKRLQDRTHS